METKQKLPLTPRQESMKNWIYAHVDQYGVCPSRQALMSEFSVNEPNLTRYIDKLVERGWLERVKGIQNGIVVPR